MMSPKFSDIVQVAVVVTDIQSAMERYETVYGIGPWETMHLTRDSARDIIVNGVPISEEEDYQVILAMAHAGNMNLELIQPLTPNSDYYTFLQEHGEGFHHVAIVQDPSFFSLMEERGIKQLASATIGHTDCVYYDTRKDLGFIVETFHETEAADR